MITIKNIIDWSKPHEVSIGGRHTKISNGDIMFSIVGGANGMYGDFINVFELAIFDKRTGNFLTNFFYPEANSDVIGYMSGEEIEVLLNKVFRDKDFQVG
jgi:hypothetical protein